MAWLSPAQISGNLCTGFFAHLYLSLDLTSLVAQTVNERCICSLGLFGVFHLPRSLCAPSGHSSQCLC